MRCLRDGDLTGQDGQHDPSLLLGREHRRLAKTITLLDDQDPEETGPARNLDARQSYPPHSACIDGKE
jgi:hypothetical protein